MKINKQQQKVDDWSAKYSVGQAVTLTNNSGKVTVTKTRTKAQLLSGHTAVVWLEGVVGCWGLGFIKAEAEGRLKENEKD